MSQPSLLLHGIATRTEKASITNFIQFKSSVE